MSGGVDIVRFAATLLMWHGQSHAGIGYVVVEGEAADAISAHELLRRLELGKRRGFGSVKVKVRVGGSCWATSVFPQQAGSWFLPMKKSVHRSEMLQEGDKLEVELALL